MSLVEDAVRENRPLTAEEAESYVADLVRETFGLSVPEFIAEAEAGRLEDHPATSQLAVLTGARLKAC